MPEYYSYESHMSTASVDVSRPSRRPRSDPVADCNGRVGRCGRDSGVSGRIRQPDDVTQRCCGVNGE